MSFNLDPVLPLRVTVDARVDGQQVLNVFDYRFEDEVDPSPGASTNFLSEFRAAWRLFAVANLPGTYAVYRYWLRSIVDAMNIAPIGEKPRWIPIYSYTGLDYLPGTSSDKGGRANPVAPNTILPTHECMRISKNNTEHVRGYFKAGETRLCPFYAHDLDDTLGAHDLWTTAWLATMQTSASAFVATTFWGNAGHAGSGCRMAIFSPAYYGNVVKPGGGNIFSAMVHVGGYTAQAYVGTQTTRRYKPAGGFRGA